MENYVSSVQQSNREISNDAVNRTRRLIAQSEVLLKENEILKEELKNLARENEDLHYLCRKNQLLNKDFTDFESTLQLKGMTLQTHDPKEDVPFFPGQPIWQRMKRKTEVSTKIINVFGKDKIKKEAGMVASKSARNLGVTGRGELKEFISNRGNETLNLDQIKKDIIEKRETPGIKEGIQEAYGQTQGKLHLKAYE